MKSLGGHIDAEWPPLKGRCQLCALKGRCCLAMLAEFVKCWYLMHHCWGSCLLESGCPPGAVVLEFIPGGTWNLYPFDNKARMLVQLQGSLWQVSNTAIPQRMRFVLFKTTGADYFMKDETVRGVWLWSSWSRRYITHSFRGGDCNSSLGTPYEPMSLVDVFVKMFLGLSPFPIINCVNSGFENYGNLPR